MVLTNFVSQTELSPLPQLAKVTQQIGPEQLGQVRFQATYWRARFATSDSHVVAKPKATVQVIGREGLTLIVVPIEQSTGRVF